MALSEDAIAGLFCWLMGQFSRTNHRIQRRSISRYFRQDASAEDSVRPHPFTAVTLHGSDSDAAAEESKSSLRAAFQNVVQNITPMSSTWRLVCGVNAMISWRNRTGFYADLPGFQYWLVSRSYREGRFRQPETSFM